MERLKDAYLAEQWKTIIGHPDYEISTHGRIRRITDGTKAKAGYILACPVDPSKDGHRVVNMQGKVMYVGKLVAETFLGPRPEGYELHHSDEDPSNDWLYNLEYITAQEHRQITAKHNPRRKLSTEEITEIKSFAAIGKSTSELASIFGVSTGYMRRILSGERRNIQ